MNLHDTIGAIATPNGVGAISIIRVSGTTSIEICDSVFKSKNPKKKLIDQKSHTLHFGVIYSGDQVIDEVLVSVFRNPKSFTGENSIEISCHASPYIQQEILELLQQNGVRIAEPGEFTFRSFMNGKLDLIQAESIADIIASQSKSSHQIAINQMRGNFSNELQQLRKKLIELLSCIELEIDFVEEDIKFSHRNDLENTLNDLKIRLNHLISSYQLGNVLKFGVPIVIIGQPNVGKSTLMNVLLNETRCIVSDIPGTTRDSIEEIINLQGIQFRFIDTAGIRKTDDIIESLGIEKTYQKAKSASIILYVYDENQTDHDQISVDLKLLENKNLDLILCKNKIDLKDQKNIDLQFITLNFKSVDSIKISAKNKKNLDLLKSILVKKVLHNEILDSDTILTNRRHLDILNEINDSIRVVFNNLKSEISLDVLAFNLKNVLKSFGKLTGESFDVDQDILGTIFSKFCIGK